MSTQTLLINKHNNRDNLRRISTKSSFFNGEIIFKILKDKIIFLKPDIDYRGKSTIPHFDKNTNWFFTSINCDLPVGKYEFDKEESNEDQLVVYYE